MIDKRPKVKSETDFTYEDKFSGKTKRFTTRTDEVVATFHGTAGAAAARVMRDAALSISKGPNPARGFAVFQIGPDSDVAASSKALLAQSPIANTLPALTDQEGLTRYFLPDELTVMFIDSVQEAQAERILSDKGCAIVVKQRTPGYYTVTVPEGRGLFETIRDLTKLREVAFAEPSEAGFDDALPYMPGDPDFGRLWGLHNIGQAVNGTVGTVDADIDAPTAWDYERGQPNVVIAVIDTGADLDHPDLAANILPRGAEDWDFADGPDASPDDMAGHGTHVAGTAAAIDNATGVVGIAPGCRIMPLRVDLMTGMNQNRADAINYVAAQAVAHPERRYVINCSWKMSGDHAGVHAAITNAIAKNVLVVFAAGNSNQDISSPPFYPAVYPEVMAVAATDQKDIRASFSNYGAKVSVSAPGVNVYSTYLGGAYQFLDGTSMASPHVAGLAALVRSCNSALSVVQVRTTIENTCNSIDVQNPSFVGKLGRGRINAGAAIQQALPKVRFEPERKMPFPQRNAGSSTALAFAQVRMPFPPVMTPVLLFLTQQPYSERIYFLQPSTGAVLRSIDPVANDTIGSMEWDGRFLLVANVTTGSGFINIIHPTTGAQVGSFAVPPGRGEGMAFDGRYLYYSTETRIHVIDYRRRVVVRSFIPPAPPGARCHALTWARGWLISGTTNGVITVFHPNTLWVRASFPAPGAGGAKVEGLAYDPARSELFIGNQGENLIYAGRISL